MFWNEPSLYGATFPYRDIPPMHNPIFGNVPPIWQNIPRFIPPVYGLNQPFLNVPPMGMNVPPLHMGLPMAHINPLMLNQLAHPFARPFDVPQMRWDQPIHNLYRPFF